MEYLPLVFQYLFTRHFNFKLTRINIQKEMCRVFRRYSYNIDIAENFILEYTEK